MFLASLGAQQVAVFETFVVPRFLSLFGGPALNMLIPCEGALVANLGCRTGYPDALIPKHLPNCGVYGFDTSSDAIDLARHKSTMLRDGYARYTTITDIPFPVRDSSFSHVLCIYPLVARSRFADVVDETARLVAPRGQVVFALPLRGSYQELVDLLKEYALKHDDDRVSKAVDAGQANRLTVETLSELLEKCGLVEVDVVVEQATLTFESGREFFEDPITRLMILPDIQGMLGLSDIDRPMSYVRTAIDRYWSDAVFDLSISIGCASARGV